MPIHAILIKIGLALETVESLNAFEQFLNELTKINGLDWKKQENEVILRFKEKTGKIEFSTEPFEKDTSGYWLMAQEIISEENWNQILYANDLDDDKLMGSN